VDGLWATKSEGAGLIVRAISFQDLNSSLMGSVKRFFFRKTAFRPFKVIHGHWF